MEQLHVRIVGRSAPSQDTRFVELIEAVSKSSFLVHFALDGAGYVNYVEE